MLAWLKSRPEEWWLGFYYGFMAGATVIGLAFVVDTILRH